MSPIKLDITVRKINAKTSILDIQGEVTGSAESILMDAYTQATAAGAQAVILNFSGLEYMNSSGIGLLVTLLIRTQRQKQRLACLWAERALPADLRADPARQGHRHPRIGSRGAGRSRLIAGGRWLIAGGESCERRIVPTQRVRNTQYAGGCPCPNQHNSPTHQPPRDAAYWAKPVSGLTVGDVSPEANNLNVEGRVRRSGR